MEMAVEIGEMAENATANQLVMLADEMGKCAVELQYYRQLFRWGTVLWDVIFLLMAIM